MNDFNDSDIVNKRYKIIFFVALILTICAVAQPPGLCDCPDGYFMPTPPPCDCEDFSCDWLSYCVMEDVPLNNEYYILIILGLMYFMFLQYKTKAFRIYLRCISKV
ncbi:MAG: hypothetical protein U0V72_04245 [Cytophagales bacterium]